MYFTYFKYLNINVQIVSLLSIYLKFIYNYFVIAHTCNYKYIYIYLSNLRFDILLYLMPDLMVILIAILLDNIEKKDDYETVKILKQLNDQDAITYNLTFKTTTTFISLK